MTYEFAIVPKALAMDRSVSAEMIRMYAAIKALPPDKEGWRHIQLDELYTDFGFSALRLTLQLSTAGWLEKRGSRYLLFQEKTSREILGENDPLTEVLQSVNAPDLPVDDTGSNLGSWCAHCCCWHTHRGGYTSGMEANP